MPLIFRLCICCVFLVASACEENAAIPAQDAAAASTACMRNADCANSEAARALENIRCAGIEIYCMAGLCKADCMQLCEEVREDVNPCDEPRLCAKSESGLSFCTILPIKCNDKSSCPGFLPGSSDAWLCDEGACRYPGYEFSTH